MKLGRAFVFWVLGIISGIAWARENEGSSATVDAGNLASQVTIYRDPWGIAHVDAKTDEAAVFGFLFAQAEDYFWQIEDTCVLGLGRYAEIYGVKGRDEDLLNRAFQIVPDAKSDFAKLDDKLRRVLDAGAAGLNHYLAIHPETKPRLLTRFEGWHLLAVSRHIFMTYQLLTKRLPQQYMGQGDPSVSRPVMGSNAWAIGPSRTKNKSTILFCNPHQPQFGYGQMYEGHVRSGEGWDMTGATFFGGVVPAMGHNEHLGWSHTVNRPSNVHFWLVRFDHPTDPNKYRFDDGYRDAEVWTESILVKKGSAIEKESHTFRRTVHGPVIGKLSSTDYVAANMARLTDSVLADQHLRMVRSTNLQEFKQAMSTLDLNIFNTVYADRKGNIFFLYNGAIPKRDPRFDWTQKLDGSDPRTLWTGMHALEELPQIENPPTGWIQSCNSSPFTSTDDGNPLEISYPKYLAEDRDIDCLRSKVSRHILRDLKDATLDTVCELAFDTRLYWAMFEVPRYVAGLPQLAERDKELADRVAPLLKALSDWDYRNSNDCTKSTLVEEWYRQMYESIYPPEGRIKDECAGDLQKQYRALVTAADELVKRHGDWQVKWGDVHRLQRHAQVADLIAIPFSDRKPSLPCAAVPGGLGAVFTQYYTPSINIPFVREAKKHYAVLGTTYIAVFEFSKESIEGKSLVNFGSSGDPASPHYFDQAALHSESRLRPALYDWQEIKEKALYAYRPGEIPRKK